MNRDLYPVKVIIAFIASLIMVGSVMWMLIALGL
jgi:hypothetical protein